MTEEIQVLDEQEIATAAKAPTAIATFDLSDKENQRKAYNAAVAADDSIKNHVGETIAMTGYYIESIQVVDELTGEVDYRPHVVIFAADGTTYEGQSKGLVSALQRLNAIIPNISEDEPVDIQIIERQARLGRMYTIKLA